MQYLNDNFIVFINPKVGYTINKISITKHTRFLLQLYHSEFVHSEFVHSTVTLHCYDHERFPKTSSV